MPFFGKDEKYYIGALQCGAGRDAYLQIELSESKCSIEELVPLPRIKNGSSKEVDPNRIKQSVQEGLAKTNEHFDSKYYIRRVRYVPNDSTHYDLHCRLVFEIIKHLKNGGNFADVEKST